MVLFIVQLLMIVERVEESAKLLFFFFDVLFLLFIEKSCIRNFINEKIYVILFFNTVSVYYILVFSHFVSIYYCLACSRFVFVYVAFYLVYCFNLLY